jgi:hypothetical protein
MKRTLLFKPALLALAALVVVGQPAHAALTFANGNLYLGFRATGGTGATTDYVVNIGPASNFNTNLTLTLAGISLDLTNTFGANWNTRSDVQWSIFGGTSSPNNILWGSKERTNPLAQSTPIVRRANGAQGTTFSSIQAFGLAYEGSTESSNLTGATVQLVASTNSYASFYTSGNDFGWTNLEGSFANGTSGSVLDLYNLLPAAGGNGTYVGSFTLDNSGALTFGVASVPEPSTYAMLGLGLGALAVLRLRARRIQS